MPADRGVFCTLWTEELPHSAGAEMLIMITVAVTLTALCISSARTSLRLKRDADVSPVSARLRGTSEHWRVPRTFMLGTGALAVAAWLRIGLDGSGVASAWDFFEIGNTSMARSVGLAATVLIIIGALGIVHALLARYLTGEDSSK